MIGPSSPRAALAEAHTGWAVVVHRAPGRPRPRWPLAYSAIGTMLLSAMSAMAAAAVPDTSPVMVAVLAVVVAVGAVLLVSVRGVTRVALRGARRDAAHILLVAQDCEQQGLMRTGLVDEVHQIVWDLLAPEATSAMAALAVPGLAEFVDRWARPDVPRTAPHDHGPHTRRS